MNGTGLRCIYGRAIRSIVSYVSTFIVTSSRTFSPVFMKKTLHIYVNGPLNGFGLWTENG